MAEKEAFLFSPNICLLMISTFYQQGTFWQDILFPNKKGNELRLPELELQIVSFAMTPTSNVKSTQTL